jgi:hypothetical protein
MNRQQKERGDQTNAALVQSTAMFMSEAGRSDVARPMEGTLRVRLVALRAVHLQSRPFSGHVYVMVSCDTLSQFAQPHQTPVLELAAGDGVFESESVDRIASEVVMSMAPATKFARDVGLDFTIRKVPMSGMIHLTLFRVARFGTSAVAYASLHLDAIQHQLEGGHETEHRVTWQANKGRGERMGEIEMKAFWMSTEQERVEMELMAAQVRCRTGR